MVFDRPTQKEKKKKRRYQDFNKYPKERKPFINHQQGASKFFRREKNRAPSKGKQSDLDLFEGIATDQLVWGQKDIR